MAFNLEEAARQGRSETIPSTWTKFPASRGVLWINCLVYVLGGLIIFGLATSILISGSLPGGSNGDDGLAPLEFIALVIFGGFFLVRSEERRVGEEGRSRG